MQKYSMSNKASIMSVLTLIISLVVIGLVSTGCGGGGSPSTYTLIGTAVSPNNAAVPAAGYTVKVSVNGILVATTTTAGNGAFSTPVPAGIVGANNPNVTLTFDDPSGNQVAVVPETITAGEISGTTINLGDVPVGPPTNPLVRAG
jgi:hypothetical protein